MDAKGRTFLLSFAIFLGMLLSPASFSILLGSDQSETFSDLSALSPHYAALSNVLNEQLQIMLLTHESQFQDDPRAWNRHSYSALATILAYHFFTLSILDKVSRDSAEIAIDTLISDTLDEAESSSDEFFTDLNAAIFAVYEHKTYVGRKMLDDWLKYLPNQELTLVAFEAFHRNLAPYIDRMIEELSLDLISICMHSNRYASPKDWQKENMEASVRGIAKISLILADQKLHLSALQPSPTSNRGLIEQTYLDVSTHFLGLEKKFESFGMQVQPSSFEDRWEDFKYSFIRNPTLSSKACLQVTPTTSHPNFCLQIDGLISRSFHAQAPHKHSPSESRGEKRKFPSISKK